MPFRRLLADLVAHAPGARGAIFCDHEGENVDFAVRAPPPDGCGALTDYEMKVAGAQLAAQWILLREHGESHGAGTVHELSLRAEHGTLLCHALKDGYYLVLLLAPGVPAARCTHALRQTARLVLAEF